MHKQTVFPFDQRRAGFDWAQEQAAGLLDDFEFSVGTKTETIAHGFGHDNAASLINLQMHAIYITIYHL